MSIFQYLFIFSTVLLVIIFLAALVFKGASRGRAIAISIIVVLWIFLYPYVSIACRTFWAGNKHRQVLNQFASEIGGKIDAVWLMDCTTISATYYVRIRENSKNEWQPSGYIILIEGDSPGYVLGSSCIYSGNQQGGIFPPDPLQNLD